jgi:hypothetical protein
MCWWQIPTQLKYGLGLVFNGVGPWQYQTPTLAPRYCLDGQQGDSEGPLGRGSGVLLTGRMENCMKRQVSSRVVSP